MSLDLARTPLPDTAAWIASLPAADQALLLAFYASWFDRFPLNNRIRFFRGLQDADSKPRTDAIFSLELLEALEHATYVTQAPWVFHFVLDFISTPAELTRLLKRQRIPLQGIELADYQALSKDPDTQPTLVLEELNSLVADRSAAGDPKALATPMPTIHSDLAPYSTGSRQPMLDHPDVVSWLSRLTPGDQAEVNRLYKTWPVQTDLRDECRLLLGLAELDPGSAKRPAFDSKDASSFEESYLTAIWTTAVQLRSKLFFKYAFAHLKTPSEITSLRYAELSQSGDWQHLDLADYAKAEKRVAKKSGSTRDLLLALIAEGKKNKRVKPGPAGALPSPAFHAQNNKELCADLERTYLSLLYC